MSCLSIPFQIKLDMKTVSSFSFLFLTCDINKQLEAFSFSKCNNYHVNVDDPKKKKTCEILRKTQ